MADHDAHAARIAGLIDWNPTCLPGQHETTIVRQILDSAASLGLLADPEQALDLENAKGTLAAVRWKLGTSEGRAVSMHAGEIVAERDALQTRVEQIRAVMDSKWPDDEAWEDDAARRLEEVRAALQGDQPAEPPGLCDGCDRTDMPVKASDDGRAQFCPTCLPIANEPAEPETRCMNGPAKQHTLRMVAIIKALRAAAVNGQLPATAEPLPFAKIARAIVDHWPTGEVERG